MVARGPRAVRRRAVGALLAGLVAVVAVAAPAQAAGYRYWSFWQRTGGAWSFAPTGPLATAPVDGSVEGWRFAVSVNSAAALRPRGAASFAAICARVPAAKGRKRIALVIDYGTAADAVGGARPPREHTGCASLPEDGTGADALADVARPLRYGGSGLLCAISGYPATGCGEAVSDLANATSQHGSWPSVGPYAGIGAVVLLGAGAVWQARRRRER